MADNFAKRYQDLILKADLADYSAVKGTFIFKPYGFKLWKNIQSILGDMINKRGVEDVYFPMLIPYSFLAKEKEHLEGFNPEVALITQVGDKKLESPIAIRPTSETIMYDAFSRWIRSYRDLPYKINQWVNVVRWEKRTVLFLRSSEFLWQEGHTVHASRSEASSEVLEVLDMYDRFLKEYLAIPGIKGYKTEGEKFAGALYTTTIEVLLKSKRSLQILTSHHLGQNFAKAFNIKFLDKDNKEKYPWQTSWGLSTRAIGGLIGVHMDDKGLVFPPRIAPIKVVIIPIFKGKNTEQLIKIKRYIAEIEKMFTNTNIDYKTDWSSNSPGWKFNEWEIKGVPIRIEIGENEVNDELLTCVLRTTGDRKIFKKSSQVYKQILALLDEVQHDVYQKAKTFLDDHITEARDEKELVDILKNKGGYIKVFFKDDQKQADMLQEKYKITPRVIPLDSYSETGRDFITGEPGAKVTLFAKAY